MDEIWEPRHRVPVSAGEHRACLICNGALSTSKVGAGRQVVGRVWDVELELRKSK